MNELEQKNQTRSFMKGSYEDHKLDKSSELNDSMSIDEKSRDEYEQKLHNLGGSQNNA